MLSRDEKIMLKIIFFITIMLGMMATAGMIVINTVS